MCFMSILHLPSFLLKKVWFYVTNESSLPLRSTEVLEKSKATFADKRWNLRDALTRCARFWVVTLLASPSPSSRFPLGHVALREPAGSGPGHLQPRPQQKLQAAGFDGASQQRDQTHQQLHASGMKPAGGTEQKGRGFVTSCVWKELVLF